MSSLRQYNHEKRFKDLFFVFLYLLATGYFIYLSIKYASFSGIFSDGVLKSVKSTGIAWLDAVLNNLEKRPEIAGWTWIFTAAALLLITVMFLGLFCAFPLFTVHFVFIGGMVFLFSLSWWQFFYPSLAVGYFWLFFLGAVVILFLYLWSYRRLHFTALVMQNSLGVIRKYPGLIFVAALGFLLGFLILSIAFITLTGIIGCAIAGGSHPEPFSWLNFIFMVLFLLWTMEIIINWVHTTVCGVFGCYYFYTDGEEENRGAVSLYVFFRTFFYTFGSLTLGSLFTPITDPLTCFLKGSARRTSETMNEYSCFERCINGVCMCCCGWLSHLSTTLNSYAFVQVGICGKSFYESATDTNYLLRERGFSVVMADLVAEEVTLAFSILSTAVSLFVVIWGVTGIGIFSGDSIYGSASCAVVIALLLGWLLARVMDVVITACVIATSVCFSMDPVFFSQRSPELYYRFKDKYSGFLNV